MQAVTLWEMLWAEDYWNQMDNWVAAHSTGGLLHSTVRAHLSFGVSIEYSISLHSYMHQRQVCIAIQNCCLSIQDTERVTAVPCYPAGRSAPGLARSTQQWNGLT